MCIDGPTEPRETLMEDTPAIDALSRRSLLRAATVVGVAGLATSVQADPSHATGFGEVEHPGYANSLQTPQKPGLTYRTFSGYDYLPANSTQKWDTTGGTFAFVDGSSGYARLLAQLPVGARIKEIETYGFNGSGTVSSELWVSTINTGALVGANSASTAAAGQFTLTHSADFLVTATEKATVFALLPNTSAKIFGCRVGFIAPPSFVPYGLPASRVYDTRSVGLTKLAPNEVRTVSLVLPPGISAAVLTVTLSNTEGNGGYVSVFNADTTWPGTSSVNWSAPNQDIANTVVTPVSADGKVKILGGANKTNVIIDVVGHIV